jgi:BetR domain
MTKMPFQARMIEIIRNQMPESFSLPSEVGRILNISLDSAYRRLRCETAFTLDEIVLICQEFQVPIESLTDFIGNVISFRHKPVGNNLEDFKAFLSYFYSQIYTISRFDSREVFYAAEDIPIFHHYAFPELSNFKFFYWRKAILNDESLQDLKFSTKVSDPDLIELAHKASIAYSNVPSTEIWTEETIASTIKQIKFFWEAGFFQEKSDVVEVMDALEKLIKNLQRQCDLGLKFHPDGNLTETPFTCYLSDLMIGNNCVLVKTDEKRTTFIGYNTFSFMNTRNPDFNRNNELWLNNLISKSSLISRNAEKVRNQFFKVLFRMIGDLRKFVDEN